MNQLQNITPQPTQPLLPQALPAQPQLSPLWTSSIALSHWDRYGFTVRASRIRSWIANARANGIMREGAVKRFGHRYFATPYLLDVWMDKHGERTPLTRPKRRSEEDKRKPVKKEAITSSKEQPPALTTSTAPAANEATTQPPVTKRARRQLTEAQVRQSRNQLARAAPEGQEAVIVRLAKRYGFSAQTIRDAATGRTYQHLPMPKTQPAQPKQAGKKSKTAQAVETTAPA
jgi:hypothetical protein